MSEKEIIDLGKQTIKRKSLIFIIIGGLLCFIAICALIGFYALGESKDDSGSPIPGAIVFIVLGIAFFVIAYITYRSSKDETKMLEFGKKEYERQKAIEQKNEQHQQEILPDLVFDKEIIDENHKNKVWINTETKEIQFLYLNPEKKGFGWHKCEKTKILNLSTLTDIEFLHDIDEIKKIYGDAYKGDYFSGGGVTVYHSDVHYYALAIKFEDIDYPYVKLYYGENEEKATKVYEIIRILTKKQD